MGKIIDSFNKLKKNLQDLNLSKKIFSRKRYIFLFLLFSLIIIGIFCIGPSILSNCYDPIALLSGISAYFVALFTLVYVYTTSTQVDLMNTQINEMRRDRELQCQPLPWMDQIKFKIEKPRVWYTPPTKAYGSHTRYNVNFELKNIGLNPAIQIAIEGRIVIPRENSKSEYSSSSDRIPVLEEKEHYDVSKNLHFFFSDDTEGNLLKGLLKIEDFKIPFFHYRIVFKNILGASFVVHDTFLLYIESEEQQWINNWLCQITSFKIKFKDELEQLSKLREKNRPEWELIWEKVKTEFNDSLIGNEFEIKLYPFPDSTHVKIISSERYEEIVKEMGYSGFPIALFGRSCEDEANKK